MVKKEKYSYITREKPILLPAQLLLLAFIEMRTSNEQDLMIKGGTEIKKQSKINIIADCIQRKTHYTDKKCR